MSFDLFILCPRLDRGVIERFNQARVPGLPEGLSIDAAAITADSAFWVIRKDGEEWGELYLGKNQFMDEPARPPEVTAEWVQMHFPSRGHPSVFHVAAALADAGSGWVFDPQGAAQEVGLPAGEDAASRYAGQGFYTPAITREIADKLATMFRWD